MPTNTTKPTDETLEEASKEYAAHLKAFSNRWDISMDMQAMEEHNRICRKLVRAAIKVEAEQIVDSPYWGTEG